MKPPRLKKGDTIGIVVPSNPWRPESTPLFEGFKSLMKSWGFFVKLVDDYESIDSYGVSGGTPEKRAKDINNMFRDSSINAIWCFQGGSTASQLLPLIDYECIKKNPKLFIGYSDIDVLNLAIYVKTGLTTISFSDPKIGGPENKPYFNPEYTQREFQRRIVDGESGDIQKTSEWKCVRGGKATGHIIGCNTSSLMMLAGTEYWPEFSGAILCLEGFTIDIKKAIRHLSQLKNMGVFDKISGIVVGHVYGFQQKEQLDEQGRPVQFEDIVLDITKKYDFPILKINEFGHRTMFTPIPLGIQAKIDATEKKFTLLEPCTR